MYNVYALSLVVHQHLVITHLRLLHKPDDFILSKDTHNYASLSAYCHACSRHNESSDTTVLSGNI